MTIAILFALLAGLLISLSRQLNGRLALSTTALVASYWNHVVGFVVLTALGLVIGGLWPAGALDAPWYAYLGGTLGVIFVASGSWLIARIGAITSIAVLFDIARGVSENMWINLLGVAMIIAGMTLTAKRA
jgi:bacterial/archaeal transporter family-2 protein